VIFFKVCFGTNFGFRGYLFFKKRLMAVEMTSVAPASTSLPKAKKTEPKKTVLDKFPIPDSFYASEFINISPPYIPDWLLTQHVVLFFSFLDGFVGVSFHSQSRSEIDFKPNLGHRVRLFFVRGRLWDVRGVTHVLHGTSPVGDEIVDPKFVGRTGGRRNIDVSPASKNGTARHLDDVELRRVHGKRARG
jgi:hypothetical protein